MSQEMMGRGTKSTAVISKYARGGKIGAALLGCLALLAAAGPARADHIDQALVAKSGQIMKELEARGYKNVGILKFQVKKGSAAPTLAAGKLNHLMATRLENALIMKDRSEAPIGITRGASAAAAVRDRSATYLTQAGRANLFKHTYPLAWGNRSAQVDSFLTGVVEIAPDMKKTKVTIRAFDKKNPTLRDVASFTVDTDIALLRDVNQSFVVSRRGLAAASRADDTAEELNKKAVEDAKKQTQAGVSRKFAVEEMKEYLDFHVMYDGQAVEVDADGFLAKPAAGQQVHIKLNAKVKLGLLIRVNGINTLDEERDERSDLNQYRWWVLEPSTDYMIRGFYSNGQVKPFVAKAQAEVDMAAELGDNADRHGKIDFDVFVEATAKLPEPKARTDQFALRSVNTRAATFGQLKTRIENTRVVHKGAAAKNVKTRTFIVGGAAQSQAVETSTFAGQHVGGLTINYRRDLSANP